MEIKIYLIKDCDGLKYVGSTKLKLNKRLSGHRNDIKRNTCSSNKLNLDNCIITELETCNEENRKERERYWIDNTDCVNELNTVFDKHSYDKKYIEKYREKIRQRKKEIYWLSKYNSTIADFLNDISIY